MRRSAVAILMLGALLSRQSVEALKTAPNGAVVHVHTFQRGADSLSTAVLVHREKRERDVVLYFVTSAQAQRSRDVHRNIRIPMPDGRDSSNDLVLPPELGVDIAVLRVITRDSNLVPARVSLGSPGPGAAFLVVGLDGNGSPVTRGLRARLISTRFVIGDQDVSGLPGCLGAPAVQGDAVFGVVAECAPGRVAIIAQLAAAAGFLRQHVPGLAIGSGTWQ